MSATMWIDWTRARGGYFVGRLKRPFGTPKPEKLFRKEFDFEVNLDASPYVRQNHIVAIKSRLQELAKQWLEAEEKAMTAHENLMITIRSVRRSPRQLRDDVDFRLRQEDLRMLFKERDEAWKKLEDACMLPSKVGYSEVSTNVGIYLPPLGSPLTRTYPTPEPPQKSLFA